MSKFTTHACAAEENGEVLHEVIRAGQAVTNDPDDRGQIDLRSYRLSYVKTGYWLIRGLDTDEEPPLPTGDPVDAFTPSAFDTASELLRYLNALQYTDSGPEHAPEVA